MKFKKTIIATVFLCGVVGGGLYAWQQMVVGQSLSEEQKNKAYEQLLGRELKIPAQIETQEYNGKNFSLKYPSNFSVRQDSFATESAKMGEAVELLRLISQEPRVNITVQVTENQMTKLPDFSGVKFRTGNNEYVQSNNELKGLTGIMFSKESSEPEVSLFFKQDNLIYSVIATGSSFEQLEKYHQIILEQLHIHD